MNWFKKNKKKIFIGAAVAAVLVFAFWYGGDAPGLKGWSVKDEQTLQSDVVKKDESRTASSISDKQKDKNAKSDDSGLADAAKDPVDPEQTLADESSKKAAEEAESMKKAEEEAKKTAEAASKAAEDAKKKAAQAKTEEEKRQAEEALKQAEEDKKAADEAAKKAEDAARKAAEEAEAQKKAAEEAAKKAAEETEAKKKAEEEASKKAEDAAKAAEEAKKKAEQAKTEEEKRQAEEALKKAEEEKKAAEEAAKKAAEEEAARKNAEEEAAKKAAEEEAAKQTEGPKQEIDPETGMDKYNTEPVPEGMPIPVEPQDQVQEDEIYYCTFSISCASILNNMEYLDPEKEQCVPADGWILYPQTVAFSAGQNVYDVLAQVCMENGIHMEASFTPMYNSVYIEGINNLYEFDCGQMSGWMYKVNEWFPNYGASRYVLQDGDVCCWVYTCDLGYDVGGGYAMGY